MRSWLLISAISLLFIFGCCGQKGQGDPDGKTGSPTDTTGRREAPKHNAPDQERIDSLKQEKLKEKR
jgi:hypothetical protein